MTGSRGWGATGSHERIETVVTVEKLMQSDAKDIGGLDRDILEWNVPEEVLAVLLKDRSTGRNLIWATDRQRGMEYGNFR